MVWITISFSPAVGTGRGAARTGFGAGGALLGAGGGAVGIVIGTSRSKESTGFGAGGGGGGFGGDGGTGPPTLSLRRGKGGRMGGINFLPPSESVFFSSITGLSIAQAYTLLSRSVLLYTYVLSAGQSAALGYFRIDQ